MSLEHFVRELLVHAAEGIDALVSIAKHSLDHEKVSDGITNVDIADTEQRPQFLSFDAIFEAFKGLIKFVPLDSNGSVTVGLIIGTDDIVFNDGVRVLHSRWYHLGVDATAFDEVESLRICVCRVNKDIRD